MPASIFGNPAAVVQLNQALFGIAPGNGKYTNQLDQANAVGAIPFARQLGQTVAATNEALAATVLANVGIVNATLQTALVQAFAAFPNDRGVVVLNLTNILTTLEGNAVYGAAAAQFNAQVATDFQYSTNPVNTQDSPVNAGTATLTANTDILTGNVFEAGLVFTPGGDDRINSLQDEDRLTGTGTNATLNATVGNANDNGGTTITPTLNNVATVNIAFTGAGGGAGAVNILDLQDAAGVVNLGITRISTGAGANFVAAQNIQTAGTNNLSIAGVQVPATIFFDYADGALAAKDDAGTLNLASVNLQSVTIDQNAVNPAGGANEGFNTLTVRTTGANQVNNLISGETSVLNLAAAGGSLSLANLTGNLLNVPGAGGAPVVPAAQPGTAVTIGAGEFQALAAVSFNNGGGVLSAINGSTSTGNLTVDITGYEAPRPNPQNSGVLVTTTVTGGSGNDRIISAGNINNTGLTIDGGTGTNTLALYNNLLDQTPTDNIRPTITNIQALEVRTQANAAIVADVSAVGGLQNIILRNETASAAASSIDLRELTQAQANAITINHGASRGNGINVGRDVTVPAAGVDGTTLRVNLNDASGAADTVTLALRTDLNNNNRFNIVLDADGNALAATTAAAGHAQGNAGVENITINDTDNESNAIELTKFAEHTGAITVTGGVAGQFMQLDATANAYRWDQSGNVNDGGTGSAGVTAINGRATNGSRSDVGGGAAERLVAATFDSSAYLGDVVIRVGDNAAAASLGGQRITFGAGNDTVIFDQVAAAAANRFTAGLTISDTVNGGAGTDILGIDGNGVAVTITASEWTNVSNFEVIRLIGNGVVAATSNARNAVNNYNLTLTNDLLANNGAVNGNGRQIIIVNDNDATNDAGQANPANSTNDNAVAANGATNNGNGIAGNIGAATGVERGVTIDARTLTANNSFEYRGEEGAVNNGGNTSTADRFILADANINGVAIIDGGATSNVTQNTSTAVVGGVVTPAAAIAGNRDIDSLRNADVIEVRNAATVSEGDLANISNVGTLEFTNDTTVAQNSILVLNDAIVDRLVDAYQAARVEANVGTVTQVLQNQERLVVKAINNPNVAAATTGISIQAGTLTGQSALDVFLDRDTLATPVNITTGGGNDRVVILGNFAVGAYGQDIPTGENINAFANGVAGARAVTGTINLGGQTGIGGANNPLVDVIATYGATNLAGLNMQGVDAIDPNSALVITASQLANLSVGVRFTGNFGHQLIIIDDVPGGNNIDLSKIVLNGGSLNFNVVDANFALVNAGAGTFTFTNAVIDNSAAGNAIYDVTLTNPAALTGTGPVVVIQVVNAANSPFAANVTQSLQADQGNADSALGVTLPGGTIAANVTYTGFNGNDTLFISNTNISALNGGAATGFGTIDLGGGGANSQPTLTLAQHNATVIFANALDGGDRLNISDVATNLTGRANVAGYGVAGGSTFTLGAAGQNWTESSNVGQVSILDLGGLVTTGTLNGSGNDTLRVAASATLSGVAPGFVNVDFANTNGVVFTVNQAQHEGIGNLINVANTQTYRISGAGAVTARVGIENYDTTAVANNTANQVTVNAGATGVNITTNDAVADTIIVGGLTVTGNYNTDGTDILSATTGANIAGVNGGGAFTGFLQLANNASITMTSAQHNGIGANITANGAETVTFTTAFNGTANQFLETFNLGNFTNDFTFNANATLSQTVNGNVGADTVRATLDNGTAAADIVTASLGVDAVADRINITNTALTTLNNGGYVNVNNFTVANDQVGSVVNATAHNAGFQTISTAGANLTVGGNSVIEINAAIAQYAGAASNATVFTDAAKAIIGNAVGNTTVNGGDYSVVIYSGNNAALFQFTTTANVADITAANITQIELVGVFNNVGADAFTGANFV